MTAAMTWLALAALVAGCAVLTTTLGALVAGLRGAWRSDSESMHARARRWWPVRTSCSAAAYCIPLAVCAAACLDPSGGAPRRVLHGAVALAGVSAVGVTTWICLQPSGLVHGALAFVRTTVAITLLLRNPFVSAMLVLLACPTRWGPRAWWLLAGTPLVWLVVSYLVLPLLSAIGVTRRADDALLRRIQDATPASGTAARSAVVADVTVAQGMAFPLERVVLVTQPLLEILSAEELDAVVAHESVHLAMPWSRLAPRLAAELIVVMMPLTLPLGRSGPGAAVLATLLLLGALLLKQRLSRSLHADEEAADDGAHGHDGSGRAIAAALVRISTHNLIPFSVKGASHPTTVERIQHGGGRVSEDARLPASPARVRWGARLVVVGMFLTFFVYNLALLRLAG